MSKMLRFAIAGLCMLAWVAKTQATILTFEGFTTNAVIPSTFGDNVAAGATGISVANGTTPNIGLTWSTQVNPTFTGSAAQRWEFYNTGDWPGVAQLNNVYEAFAHNLTFTPVAGYGVLVDSFVVDDWGPPGSSYKGGNQLHWNLFEGFVGGTLIAFGTADTTDGQNLLVNPGMASAYFGTVVLQFIGGDDPDDTVFGNANRTNTTGYQGIDDLAIDDISFQQVLEPETTVAGDFDGDGDVDGADFVVWQTNFPTSSGANQGTGDADGDFDVDGADFAAWQLNFPTSPSPGTFQIPEPMSIFLAGIGCLGLLLFKNLRRVPTECDNSKCFYL